MYLHPGLLGSGDEVCSLGNRAQVPGPLFDEALCLLQNGGPGGWVGHSFLSRQQTGDGGYDLRILVGIDFKENETYAAAGDQSAVGVVASDAALNQFFYAADGIDNNNDAAAVVRALECVLKQVKDVGFAPDDVLVYRSGRGLSETQLKDLRDNEVRAAAPRIFIFSPIIPCSRFITRSPKSSGRSTPCSEATTRSPTSPTRE